MRKSLLFTGLLVTSLVVACSSESSSSGGASNDPASTCTSLCTKAGFTTSRLDSQPNELNCFCSGGSGAVTQAICTEGCTGLGKSKAQPFGQSAGKMDACQCS
ncbi:MAG: hypothetical protein JST00_21190 [Deltaproteobacteria bacterium]|nr:hypothetical protein [Deltaproteobacteria bacterium]